MVSLHSQAAPPDDTALARPASLAATEPLGLDQPLIELPEGLLVSPSRADSAASGSAETTALEGATSASAASTWAGSIACCSAAARAS